MEIWRDIDGYDGLYQVSNFGRVRRLHKTTPPRILKPVLARNYLIVQLSCGNKVKNHFVHRLIAMAFISNPEGKPTVNHIDGIKTDNRVENLKWCTQGEDHPNAKLTAEQVVYIRDNPGGLTGREPARLFGVGETTICNVRHGEHYRTAGGTIRNKF